MLFIETLIQLIAALLKLIFDILVLLYRIFVPARTKEINAKLTPARKVLSRKNKGWAVGIKAILLDFRSFFIAAATGFGKSSYCVIPGILGQAGKGPVIVVDSGHELYQKTSGFFKSQDIPIKVFDLSDKTGYYSDGWNCFPTKESEVDNFCKLTVELSMGADPRDPYWTLSSSHCLGFLAKTLFRLPEKYRTMGCLYDLVTMLAAKPKVIEKWMAKYADETGWLEFMAFMMNSPNTRASIVSSARAAISIFGHEHIKRITSHSTIDFDSLRTTQQIIYLTTSGAELHLNKLLLSLFFDNLFSTLVREVPPPNSLPVHIMLEESGIFKIPNLPFAITQCRKNLVNICCVVQNENQWRHLYSKEECDTLLSNFNTKLYLSNSPLNTSRELSELSGVFAYRDKDNHLKQAAVLTPQEIREIPIGTGILMHSNLPPAHIKNIIPYYMDRKMKALTSLPPAHIDRKLPDGPIPMLPISKLLEEPINTFTNGK